MSLQSNHTILHGRERPHLGGVFIGLGGNLAFEGLTGRRLFEIALIQIMRSGLQPIAVSSLWTSPAWPDPSTPQYFNAVAEINPGDIDPLGLLKQLQDVEQKMGRVRTNQNAARTLDLDLLDYRGRVFVSDDEAGLTVPHLRMHERSFVLGPLQEIAPRWRHPVLDREIQGLYADAASRWPAETTGESLNISQAPQNLVEIDDSLD